MAGGFAGDPWRRTGLAALAKAFGGH
jgi:hypothetical protein